MILIEESGGRGRWCNYGFGRTRGKRVAVGGGRGSAAFGEG